MNVSKLLLPMAIVLFGCGRVPSEQGSQGVVTGSPSATRTPAPTATHTRPPAAPPTLPPTVRPTVLPTVRPTVVPTASATAVPPAPPTAAPTTVPSNAPPAPVLPATSTLHLFHRQFCMFNQLPYWTTLSGPLVATTGDCPVDSPLGFLYDVHVQYSVELFHCDIPNSADRFDTPYPDCEGLHTAKVSLGFIKIAGSANDFPVYRCYSLFFNRHMLSRAADCEQVPGQPNNTFYPEFIIGYAPYPSPALNAPRHPIFRQYCVFNQLPYWTTLSGALPPATSDCPYDTPLGYLYDSQEPGTTELFHCDVPNSSERFDTTAADCEGLNTAKVSRGFVLTHPAPDASPVYRCFNPGNSRHMLSRFANCEQVPSQGSNGFHVEVILGYAPL